MKSVENVWLKPAASRCSQSAVNQGKSEDSPHKHRGEIPSPSSTQLTPAGMLVTVPCSLKRSELQRHSSFIRSVPALSPSQPPKFRPCISLRGGTGLPFPAASLGAAAAAHPGQGRAEGGSGSPGRGRALRRASLNSRGVNFGCASRDAF